MSILTVPELSYRWIFGDFGNLGRFGKVPRLREKENR